MLGFLFKFVLPAFLLYLAGKFIRGAILAGSGHGGPDSLGDNRAKGPVIEICPTCGHQISPGHRCT